MDSPEAKRLLTRPAVAEAFTVQDDGSIPETVKEDTIRRAKHAVAVLVLVNVAMWVGTIFISSKYPVILSPALVAYSLGLRHAVDADHIAAIDNVTRTLLQRGRQSVTVGLFFSLGHSSVVILMCIVVVCSASAINLDTGKSIGAIVGAAVSATFLTLIGLVNAFAFVRISQQWNAARQQRSSPTAAVDHGSNVLAPAGIGGGILSSCCPSLLGVVDQPWKMYPLGFLFGLGFDTASEVALLAISALASQSGVPSWVVLVLPGLFTCGMSLVDTLDGAYSPSSMLRTMLPSTSFLVAQGVLTGWAADVIQGINDNFELLGCIVIGLFVVSFALSVLVYEAFFAADEN